MIPILITISILLSSLRALGFRSQAFQACAHFFVDGLIASRHEYLFWLMIGLSIVEIICFLAFRKKNEQSIPGGAVSGADSERIIS